MALIYPSKLRFPSLAVLHQVKHEFQCFLALGAPFPSALLVDSRRASSTQSSTIATLSTPIRNDQKSTQAAREYPPELAGRFF